MYLSPYEEYAVVEAKIKALTTEKDELRVKILEEMVARGEKKTETAVGSFAIASLKTWTYTPAVAQLEADYKERKAIEENTGEATFVEKPSLRFTQLKL